MQAFYMGNAASPLFGLYHPPTVTNGNNYRSVLMCAPVGDEYLTTHWSLMRLARLLADSGYHVLRFDYTGTGDSAGEFEAAAPSKWIEDILQAAQELADLSANTRVILLGTRFGAVLAAVAALRLEVEQVLAWEPTLVGEEFINRLVAADKNRKSKYDARFYASGDDGQVRELGGFRFSYDCLDEIRSMNLEPALLDGNHGISVVCSSANDLLDKICDELRLQGKSATCSVISQEDDWAQKLVNLERIQTPNRTLEALRDALTV